MQTAVVFSGKSQIDRYVATVLRSALKLYHDTGMRVNRAYTPKAMMAKASELTGRRFAARAYTDAIEALTELLEAEVEVTETEVRS